MQTAATAKDVTNTPVSNQSIQTILSDSMNKILAVANEDEEFISDKCIWCGKPAKHMAYWGKSY